MSEDAKRYRMGDMFHEIYVDLAYEARTLKPWDADARERWMDASVWLLRQVPCASQRISWAHTLSINFNQAGCPLDLVVGELWRRVEERS